MWSLDVLQSGGKESKRMEFVGGRRGIVWARLRAEGGGVSFHGEPVLIWGCSRGSLRLGGGHWLGAGFNAPYLKGHKKKRKK